MPAWNRSSQNAKKFIFFLARAAPREAVEGGEQPKLVQTVVEGNADYSI
jgi:hypothetical protein